MAHKQPLADIQFLADFHAYCLTRGDEEYDYECNRQCACAQFLRDSGKASRPTVTSAGWLDIAKGWDGERQPLPAGLEGIGGALMRYPQDFSALATRIEALLADAPVVRPA